MENSWLFGSQYHFYCTGHMLPPIELRIFLRDRSYYLEYIRG